MWASVTPESLHRALTISRLQSQTRACRVSAEARSCPSGANSSPSTARAWRRKAIRASPPTGQTRTTPSLLPTARFLASGVNANAVTGCRRPASTDRACSPGPGQSRTDVPRLAASAPADETAMAADGSARPPTTCSGRAPEASQRKTRPSRSAAPPPAVRTEGEAEDVALEALDRRDRSSVAPGQGDPPTADVAGHVALRVGRPPESADGRLGERPGRARPGSPAHESAAEGDDHGRAIGAEPRADRIVRREVDGHGRSPVVAPHRSVLARAEDERRSRNEGHRRDGPSLPGQRHDPPLVGQVPDDRGAVESPTGHPPGVTADRDGGLTGSECVEVNGCTAARDVHDAHRVVVAGREEAAAVGREREATDDACRGRRPDGSGPRTRRATVVPRHRPPPRRRPRCRPAGRRGSPRRREWARCGLRVGGGRSRRRCARSGGCGRPRQRRSCGRRR